MRQTRRACAADCARAARGENVAPTSPPMTSRRLIRLARRSTRVQATPAAARESRGAMSLEGGSSRSASSPRAEMLIRSVVAVRRLVKRRALKHRATGGPEPGREREAQRHDNKGSKPFSACGSHAARIAQKRERTRLELRRDGHIGFGGRAELLTNPGRSRAQSKEPRPVDLAERGLPERWAHGAGPDRRSADSTDTNGLPF
jgi:hypothetical protein